MLSVGVVVITRPPVPGTCKMRLARTIGENKAAELMSAMTIDTLQLLGRFSFCEQVLLTTENIHDTPIADVAKSSGWTIKHHQPCPFADLFEGALYETVLESDIVLFSVTDAPITRLESLELSLTKIINQEVDSFVMPATDGGFNMLAVPRDIPTNLFENISWSSASVFEELIENLKTAGLSTHVAESYGDIDDYQSAASVYQDMLDKNATTNNTYYLLESLFSL